MLSMTAITLHLRREIADSEASGDVPAAGSLAAAPTKVTIPWTGPAAVPVKGIVHVPAHNTPMKPGGRETLLIAIAKARKWVKDVLSARVRSRRHRWAPNLLQRCCCTPCNHRCPSQPPRPAK